MLDQPGRVGTQSTAARLRGQLAGVLFSTRTHGRAASPTTFTTRQ